MKYRVIIDWRCEFDFDDPEVAMNFAITAEKHRSSETDDKIRIEFINWEEGEKDD